MKKIYILLLNLGYWLLLFLLVVILYIASQINSVSGPSITSLSTLLIGYIFIPSIISFYGSYFFLFQLYIKKVKKFKLLIFTGSLIIISCLTSLISIYNFVNSEQALLEIGLVSFFLNAFHASIGFILHSFISWFTDVKIKDELSKKTQLLELEMVKLKLDPHFLFNTINNIDVLIETDSEKASEYIIKLSSILRFYLYRSSNSSIYLSEEIRYIKEYVELQKIRTSNEDYVHLTIQGNAAQKEIAPMILTPFIENAFKHSPNKKTNYIDIQISIQDNSLIFKCSNTIDKTKKAEKGIGNQLVENRLKLLYGNNYDLNVNISEENYVLNLCLPL
ncbi:MAG: hypothetical protein EP338_10005 [Bacteroidetes bacterium]|nr:MAG: hypothetical protein EP338_10005 [Bacteroidota bacterium]